MSATKTKVQGIIDDNAVAVFSKSYCPYCRATKQLLSDSGAKFYAIELDQVGMFTKCPSLSLHHFLLSLRAIYTLGSE
jgi:hypothetical protein